MYDLAPRVFSNHRGGKSASFLVKSTAANSLCSGGGALVMVGASVSIRCPACRLSLVWYSIQKSLPMHGLIGCSTTRFASFVGSLMGTNEFAICASCGVWKASYADRCQSCNHLPTTDCEIARSLILSSDFQFDVLNLPRTEDELLDLGKAIAMGRSDVISSHDVEIVRLFLADLSDVQSRLTIQRVIQFGIIPVLLLLAFVAYVFTLFIGA